MKIKYLMNFKVHTSNDTRYLTPIKPTLSKIQILILTCQHLASLEFVIYQNCPTHKRTSYLE